MERKREAWRKSTWFQPAIGLTLARHVPALDIGPDARRRSALLRLADILIRAAMSCFRYVTPVVKGRWRRSEEEALSDALEAGQAYMSGGRTILFEFARIEHGEPGACCPEIAGNPGDLRAQAAQCRWLAKSTSDERTTRILLQMANDYDARARLLDPQPHEAPVIIAKPR